jgi:hypothetical protein
MLSRLAVLEMTREPVLNITMGRGPEDWLSLFKWSGRSIKMGIT